jgi:hypothetical protein
MEVYRSLRLQALCHVKGLCSWDTRVLEEIVPLSFLRPCPHQRG